MPRETAVSRSPAVVVSSSRAARSSASPMRSTASGSPSCSASARVAASGVEPTTWNIATDPDEAAAAPSALRRSSDWPAGRPSTAATAEPACRPTTSPRTGNRTSASRSASGTSASSRRTRVARRASVRWRPAYGTRPVIAAAMSRKSPYRFVRAPSTLLQKAIAFDSPQATCSPNEGRASASWYGAHVKVGRAPSVRYRSMRRRPRSAVPASPRFSSGWSRSTAPTLRVVGMRTRAPPSTRRSTKSRLASPW